MHWILDRMTLLSEHLVTYAGLRVYPFLNLCFLYWFKKCGLIHFPTKLSAMMVYTLNIIIISPKVSS